MMSLSCLMVLIHNQYYIEYIMEKLEALSSNPPIHIQTNRINNRVVFSLKDGYQVELQMPDTIKLFCRTKNILEETYNNQKIPLVLKFMTRKWIEVNELSGGQYSVSKSNGFETPMLRSDLCDYSLANIVVKGTIDLLTDPENM